MKCKPLFLGRQDIGERFDGGNFFVFFGNRHLHEKALRRMFSQYHFEFLKQTHSDISVEIVAGETSHPHTADASLTSNHGIALGIYTADCAPIMIFDPARNKVAAIHAGWRGVASQIAVKTLDKLGPNREGIKVWIGPHIRTKSFEVHADVAQQLANSHMGKAPVVFDHPTDSNKRKVDITAIILGQLTESGVSRDNVYVSDVDTFASQDHFSFRRDGSTGRLLSFIALNE